MDFRILEKDSESEVANLFTSAFSNSEGEEEGKLIGCLASQLASRAGTHDVLCIGAFLEGEIIGVIFFTELHFEQPVKASMLAPVAVSTSHQRKGVGQALIQFGLRETKKRGAFRIVTYGDPAYYSKVGFQPLSEDVLSAPLPLSMPEGWLGQSLSGEPIPELKSRPRCVPEFNNPEYW